MSKNNAKTYYPTIFFLRVFVVRADEHCSDHVSKLPETELWMSVLTGR